MNKAILKIIALILIASFCLSGFLIVRYIIHLPFRDTNDDLHKKKSPVTLDFLIPAGTHLDEKMTIEYGVGVVTLIGDRMKDSSGVASIAIGAIPGINIKRGIFAPHTSQIILVVEEKNVDATVSAIHLKRDEMNRPR